MHNCEQQFCTRELGSTATILNAKRLKVMDSSFPTFAAPPRTSLFSIYRATETGFQPTPAVHCRLPTGRGQSSGIMCRGSLLAQLQEPRGQWIQCPLFHTLPRAGTMPAA